MAAIERAVAPFLVSPDWEPLYPMHSYGVYASRWPLGQRDSVDHRQSQQLRHRRPPDERAAQPRECATSTSTTALKLKPGDRTAQNAVLSFDIEANGYGAILATPGEPERRRSRP